MARCASGGIILSSVDTRYQLGLALHAGSVTAPLSASSHEGCRLGANVRSERLPESRAIEEQEPALRRQDRWYRRARRRVLDQARDGLASVRSKRRNVDQAGDLRIVSGLGDAEAV
jgi:hypothetical protein